MASIIKIERVNVMDVDIQDKISEFALLHIRQLRAFCIRHVPQCIIKFIIINRFLIEIRDRKRTDRHLHFYERCA